MKYAKGQKVKFPYQDGSIRYGKVLDEFCEGVIWVSCDLVTPDGRTRTDAIAVLEAQVTPIAEVANACTCGAHMVGSSSHSGWCDIAA